MTRHLRILSLLAGIASSLALASCATQPTARASMVRVASKEHVAGYRFLGVVMGTSWLYGLQKGKGYSNALNELLEAAAARGATHIVFDPANREHFGGGQVVRGEAYRAQ